MPVYSANINYAASLHEAIPRTFAVRGVAGLFRVSVSANICSRGFILAPYAYMSVYSAIICSSGVISVP